MFPFQAKHIFQRICGEEEGFLPAIPNPEDIIMDDIPPDQENHAGLVGGVASGNSEVTDNPSEENPAEEQDNVGVSGVNIEESAAVLDDRPVEETNEASSSPHGSANGTSDALPIRTEETSEGDGSLHKEDH